MSNIVRLPERGVIEINGADRVVFLQGLVSNDIAKATPGHAVWSALLTPQGKWLADFFVLAEPETLLLDCERAQAEMIVKLLSRYRLRAKVVLRDASDDWNVYAAWGEAPVAVGVVIAPDPRLEGGGWRVLSPTPLDETATEAAYQAHRIGLGLPDGSRDMESEKSVLLEAGFDELQGVSWTKGCYMGQELTARTKHRGLVKRRLVPVQIDGPMPAPGTPVLRDGIDVGTLRTGVDGIALALLRLEALEAEGLRCGDAGLVPLPPSWMTLPVAK